jgi:hypothetical protein
MMICRGRGIHYAFKTYAEAVYWVKQIQLVDPDLNVQITNLGWEIGEHIIVVRLNDALLDKLGISY